MWFYVSYIYTAYSSTNCQLIIKSSSICEMDTARNGGDFVGLQLFTPIYLKYECMYIYQRQIPKIIP